MRKRVKCLIIESFIEILAKVQLEMGNYLTMVFTVVSRDKKKKTIYFLYSLFNDRIYLYYSHGFLKMFVIKHPKASNDSQIGFDFRCS